MYNMTTQNRDEERMPSKTAEYYKKHPEAYFKKKAYDKKFNKRPDQRKYRATLNAVNRELGTYGNGDGKDVSHTTKKHVYVLEDESSNRARQGASNKSTKLKVTPKHKTFTVKITK